MTHLPNIRYACGFTGSAAALLITNSASIFFSDGRYSAQAKREVDADSVVIGRKAPQISAAEWTLSKRNRAGQSIGFEAEHLSFAECQRLRQELGPKFRLKPTSHLVERLRAVKDQDEVALLRAAVHLGAKLFDDALEVIRPGVSEATVAGAMELSARKAGAEGMSFPTIIASGERSALPHGRASGASIPTDGFVVCDFGVILAGYCSDQTRTVYVGSPSRAARRVYTAVKQAQQAGLEAIRPGRRVSQIDRAARKQLEQHNLGKYFTHSTGHGVGLEIHEAPRIAAGQQETLVPGMVITVEPGIYIPGRWGVRIEDVVVVTDHGCEVLTPTSKELTVI